MTNSTPPSTWAMSVRGEVYYVRRFAVTVVNGPDKGQRCIANGDELTIGTDEGNDLRLTDPSVSRHHLSLRAFERGLEVRDLDSTNGTFLDDFEITTGYLQTGTRLKVGRSEVIVEFLNDEIGHPLAPDDRFGTVVGASAAMRRLFPMLERCAESTATVLITGETGTGKEVVAESIHQASKRSDEAFVIVDCGALPRNLMESELFGHTVGAFTGAEAGRMGAFEAANGGTIFLDEIGELPLDLQPVLLRVLDSQRFRRVGSDKEQDVDVRIVAATNRDLRIEVNKRRFRSDLFYRLNVLRVELPPLRDREGDIERLAAHFWNAYRPGKTVPSDLLKTLRSSNWPGNVRELRNAVERASLIGWEPPTESSNGDEWLSFADAKKELLEDFELDYLKRLLARAGGNLSKAARDAKMSRSHLRLVMQRHRIEREDFV